MELKSFKYRSAVVFGVLSLVFMLIAGGLMLYQKSQVGDTMFGADPNMTVYLNTITPINSLVWGPLLYGVITYLFALIAIFIYNQVAKKYPISWDVKK